MRIDLYFVGINVHEYMDLTREGIATPGAPAYPSPSLPVKNNGRGDFADIELCYSRKTQQRCQQGNGQAHAVPGSGVTSIHNSLLVLLCIFAHLRMHTGLAPSLHA